MTDDHDQTYGEAVDETLEDGVAALTALNELIDEILEEMKVGDAETRAAGEAALERLQPMQQDLVEGLEGLAKTRDEDPLERLSDEQRARFRAMFGPLPPGERGD